MASSSCTKKEGTDLTATLDPITDALAPDTLDALIEAALAEDIGAGDVTTDATANMPKYVKDGLNDAMKGKIPEEYRDVLEEYYRRLSENK